jgi:hypothetical protein
MSAKIQAFNEKSNTEVEFSFEKFLSESANLLTSSEFEKNLQGSIEIKNIPIEIYNDLPKLLKDGCSTLTDKTDKEVFLYGALGCISAVLPNVEGLYDGKIYSPHIYIYVLGDAGIGKGALAYAKDLVMGIEQKIIMDSQSDEPDEKRKELFIPANSSSTGAIELLEKNDGKGLIFETEGDTLANVFKSDFGNYSDSFRKAFGHETISYYRRTDKEKCLINRPQLATVLSSTFGQLLNLIPNAENGLFSRFLYCELQASSDFKNVFQKEKRQYREKFLNLGLDVEMMYRKLEHFESIDFQLKEHQERFFLVTFSKWKKELSNYVQSDLDGTIHRLGLICFRLSMIFTTLRAFENNGIQSVIECDDIDFINALKIVEIAKNNAFAIFERLPKPTWINTNMANNLVKKAEDIEVAKKLQAEGKSLSEISKAIFGDEKHKSKVAYWLKK